MIIPRNVHLIMPVGSDPLYPDRKAALALAIHNAGLRATFPTYRPVRPSFSLSEMIEKLHQADCVVADLSLERPSCYYELGVAETLGKPTYLFAHVDTRIHQCAARDSVLFYDDFADLVRIVESALDKMPISASGAQYQARQFS